MCSIDEFFTNSSSHGICIFILKPKEGNKFAKKLSKRSQKFYTYTLIFNNM